MLFSTKDLVVVPTYSKLKSDLRQYPDIYPGYLFPEGGKVYVTWPFHQQAEVAQGGHLLLYPYPITGQGWFILSQDEYDKTFEPANLPVIDFSTTVTAPMPKEVYINNEGTWDPATPLVFYPQTT